MLPQKELLNKAATFVTRILSVLGLVAPSWDRTTAFLDTSDASSSGAAHAHHLKGIQSSGRARSRGNAEKGNAEPAYATHMRLDCT